MGEEYKVIFMSRGEAEYLTNWILQMDDDWLSRNGILHQNCMHVRLYGGDFTHDHSTFRRGFADFCRLLFRNTNRILGQHKPDLRGKWEPKGAAMSENNEKNTTDAACAKDAGKQEDWMEQKIGGVEKKEGKRVFVQPGEGLKMNEDGSAVIQITANPGDEVILSVGNSFEHPRKIQMVDEENIGLFTACVERGDFKGPQRVVFRVNDVEKLNVTMPMLHAVDDVSLKIEKGKTMGIVGESGCGKSTLGRTIIHLQDSTDGQIFLNGEDVTVRKGAQLKKLREKMQIIFQDPYSSLNPRMSVESIIADPLKVQGKLKSKGEIDAEVTRLMKLVGIEERLRTSYPHELDGGRRQRVGIARALALNPEFVVCDEPVSALDVSIQAQVLNLLMDLQQQFGLTLMFITHNLSVVRHISDDICVMYLGQVVESCETDKLFEATLHPYTKALLSAVPSVDLHHPSERILLKGEITSPIDPKPGCRFASRCPYAKDVCEQPQELKEVLPGHYVSCCRCKEINGIS